MHKTSIVSLRQSWKVLGGTHDCHGFGPKTKSLFMSWVYLASPHEFKDFQLIKPERITTYQTKEQLLQVGPLTKSPGNDGNSLLGVLGKLCSQGPKEGIERFCNRFKVQSFQTGDLVMIFYLLGEYFFEYPMLCQPCM